ncbi:transcriptional regulator, SarA/Rot family [Latilactobacillus graminis]|nr:MarR family transcriptional regulator [Latilactobacillus graminis]QFP79073.1 MarR family transcriptional regulator [Latilactobacillus graminis]
MKNQEIEGHYSRWYKNTQMIANELNALTQAYGISFEQYLILENLKQQTSTPSQLARLFNTSMPAASRKINLLQKKHYIRKLRGLEQSDQRLVEIKITPEGESVFSQIKKQLDDKYEYLDAAAREFVNIF